MTVLLNKRKNSEKMLIFTQKSLFYYKIDFKFYQVMEMLQKRY